MQSEQVDPRDIQWEVDRPVYRVYFWERGGSPEEAGPSPSVCDERRVLGAGDVHEVLAWAAQTAGPRRTFTLYVEHSVDGSPGLIRLAGTDPTGV